MTAGVTPLYRGCGHAEVDVDALLEDDRLAAAMAAPVVPGATERDLQRWIARVYVRVGGAKATGPAGLCALLHRRERRDRGLCTVAGLLRDRGFTPGKVDKQRGWLGLRLAESEFAEHGSP